MTIFQAIRQFATVGVSNNRQWFKVSVVVYLCVRIQAGLHQESEEELLSLGRPEIWIRTHTIQ